MFQPLKSSNLKGYDYDEKSSSLTITFNNGRQYRYEGVKPDVISGMLKAPSHGKYFAQNISHSYKYSQLEKSK